MTKYLFFASIIPLRQSQGIHSQRIIKCELTSMTNLYKKKRCGCAIAGSLAIEMFASHFIDKIIRRKVEKRESRKQRKRPSQQKHNNFPSLELAEVFPTAQALFNLNIKASLALAWQSIENSSGRMGLIIQKSFGWEHSTVRSWEIWHKDHTQQRRKVAWTGEQKSPVRWREYQLLARKWGVLGSWMGDGR